MEKMLPDKWPQGESRHCCLELIADLWDEFGQHSAQCLIAEHDRGSSDDDQGFVYFSTVLQQGQAACGERRRPSLLPERWLGGDPKGCADPRATPKTNCGWQVGSTQH